MPEAQMICVQRDRLYCEVRRAWHSVQIWAGRLAVDPRVAFTTARPKLSWGPFGLPWGGLRVIDALASILDKHPLELLEEAGCIEEDEDHP